MNKLENKVALITGGTSGIGYETARLFRDEGATVMLTGTNPDNIALAKTSLGVEAIRCDASKVADCESLMSLIREKYGRIDVLFANAGVPGALRTVETVDEATFDGIMAVNFRGIFFTVQKALPLMPNGGAIILTSSVGALLGMPQSLVYAASKAAVRSLGRGLAAELIPRNIRVNTLIPGLFRTPLFDKLDIPADQIIDMLSKNVPMGRAGHPMEAATAALFLACADSSFMTGAELRVSGGQTDI